MKNRPSHLFPSADRLGVLTDLYQLTMAAGYLAEGVEEPSIFELFVRRLPAGRGYLVAAGLEQAIAYLLDLSFDPVSIEALRAMPAFADAGESFFESLARFRFRGDVRAVPEGTVVFAGEPLLSVRAAPVEAQLVETYLLSTIGFQTLIATKAARVVDAAGGRAVVDFGARRAHGPQAALLAARACLVAGCAGTSNVLAAIELRQRAVGTAAHSWTMTFESETAAFEAYHRTHPSNTLLLVDTYDTLEGVRRALAVAGPDLAGVRLDSGDLVALSIETRRILDEAGRSGAKIVASGDLNEYEIERLLAAGARIDVFGVGTEMVTSRDDPSLSVVYKLVAVERDGRLLPRVKTSADKATHPYPKQVHRRTDRSGTLAGDVVAAAGEDPPSGTEPLLVEVLRGGELVAELPDLEAIRSRAADQLRRLPAGVRRLRDPDRYPVRFSDHLEAERQREAARHTTR